MILRRISQGIKAQDWFVVTVEVMIVIVGIFIGLQVDDWNEGRADREREQLYLERISQNIEVDIGRFKTFTRDGIDKLQYLAIIKKSIDSGKIEGYSIEEFFRILGASTNFGWQLPLPRRETFDEIQNTGSLDLIRNAVLRAEIARFYYEIDNRHNRVSKRMTNYATVIYELVDAKTMIAARANEEEILQQLNEMDKTFKKDAADRFLTSSNNESFLRLLNAEENFTVFLLEQYEIQNDLMENMKDQIDQEISPEFAP